MKFTPKGFTLIELVLYVGIFSILVTVLSAIFASIVTVQLDAKAVSSVDQDGRYIMGKLFYDMRASSIASPSASGQQTSTLQLQRNSINYTYSLDSNSNLQIKNLSTNEVNVLNGYDTKVTGLSFLRLGTGGSNDTIQLNYTVTSKISKPSGTESRSFQTTLGRQ